MCSSYTMCHEGLKKKDTTKVLKELANLLIFKF